MNPKHYLGTLCKRGHDYNGTGKSLRYFSTRTCKECIKLSARRWYKNNPEKVKKIHKKQRKRIRRIFCVQCGKEFNIVKMNLERRLRNNSLLTCSSKCTAFAYRKKYICSYCKKEYYRKRKSVPQKYCSKKCCMDDQTNSVILNCLQCGEKVKSQKHRIERTKYCSKKCKSIHEIGKGSPIYKHGLSRNKDYRRKNQYRNRNWKEVVSFLKDVNDSSTLEKIEKIIDCNFTNYDTKKEIFKNG